MLLALSLFAIEPAAAGNDVLYYTGHDGFEFSNFYPPTEFMEVVEQEQCGTFVETTDWPQDLSPFRVVVAVMSNDEWTPQETAQIRDFLDDGGVFVFAAETTSFNSGYRVAANNLMASLGVGSTFVTASFDTGCNRVAVPDGSHPLTTGLADTGVRYG